ncbi:MAG TPA: VIT domain-containing protein [Clostridia bacterium]|nr:VIT domain-containing protein [Clostridia bacterium]
MKNDRAAENYPLNCILDVRNGGPACPLRNVEISAVLDSSMAEVTLTQNYMNTSDHPIEALYTFPLPHGAQVTGFSCKTGTDEVKGEFREKEEAFREYDKAIRKGDSAFLLESHRPDIFQVSLGNIAAGEAVSIVISYLEDVKTTDRELRWSIPTVVAPRYIPGNKTGLKTGTGTADPTDLVPDADYITPPVGDAPYTLKIKAVLKGIKGLKKVSSPSHPVEIGFSEGDVMVSLSRENEPLDTDFVILAQLGEDSGDSFITASGSKGIFGSVSFCPDLSEHLESSGPCEYIFLIDVSGSMGGEKLEQAKRALSISLRNLFEGDYFNIIAFESKYSCFSGKSLPYSQNTLDEADKWISALTELGGTEIYEPLRFVLEALPRLKGLEKIVFLFTDGQVGNEKQITDLVRNKGVTVQLYPFGIDTAVNKYFIDSLAQAGNGIPEYIYPGERIEDKVIRQFSRVHMPYLSNLSVTGRDGRVVEAVPALPARLYDSETLSFTFRSGEAGMQNTVRIHGNIGDKQLEFELKGENTGDERLLGLKWAKARITELERQVNGSYERRNALVRREIADLSIEYSVLSTQTSLVAVYNRKIKAAGMPQTIVVPVAGPRGWTMPLAPDKAYSSAPFCVTEACMRSYPDESKEVESMSEVLAESDMLMIPSFLRKGSSNSGRSGRGGPFGSRSNKPAYARMVQAPGSPMEAGVSENKAADTASDLHEMIITAARLQNAAGSFGTGRDATLRTSCFIVGMLLLDEEWKPYRLQLIKAGEALLKVLVEKGNGIQQANKASSAQPAEASSNQYNVYASELAAAALAMLTDSGLLRRNTKISSLEGVINGLPGSASDLFKAVLSGSTDQIPDPDGSIPAGVTDKKIRAAHYLQAVINTRQALA